ncbi:hypothetical protein GEMRC1_010196 [Eukaryota sp. GEM-RC1]
MQFSATLRLTEVTLSNYNMGIKTLLTIFELVSTNKLTSNIDISPHLIDLSCGSICYNHDVSDDELLLLVDFLRQNRDLKSFDCGPYHIETDDDVFCLQGIRNYNKTKVSVEVVSDLTCNLIGSQGVRALADALKVNSSVSWIDLGNNSIGNEGVFAIAEALEVNSSVSTIYLSNNSIGNEGAIAIAEALKVNSSVSHVYLYNNSIGPEGAIAIAEALKVNSSVSGIDLGNNSIGPEGAIAIAEALKVNSSVTAIGLSNNSIGNEGAIAIAEALKVNSSVSAIYLRNNSINSQTQQTLKSLHRNRMFF